MLNLGSQKTSEDRPVVIMDHSDKFSDSSPIIQTIKKGKAPSLQSYDEVNVNSFEEYCQQSEVP